MPLSVVRFDMPSSSIKEIVRSVRDGGASGDSLLASQVREIISRVRSEGDKALIEFSRRFDGTSFTDPSELLVAPEEMKEAYSGIEKKELESLKLAYRQILFVARKQMKRFGTQRFRTPLGYSILESFTPLQRIGGYAPGGLAAYPSTALMICGPAIAAGVKEIIIATPPKKDGSVSRTVLAAAAICKAKVIKLGGAQAIAALALGTSTVPNVELIAGPGNQYVTEAKKQVLSLGDVSIDIPAGPTELLVVADESADPDLVVEDLISQAEHGNRTLCGLVTNSDDLLDRVCREIESIQERQRLEQIGQCFLFGVKSRSLGEAFEFSNSFAPEHVEVMAKKKLPNALTRAGLVLVGNYTPCSATDYIVGTNHILPTEGYASRNSGVSVETFLKRQTIVHGTRESLRKSRKALSTLALMEGLPNHALAAEVRFRKEAA